MADGGHIAALGLIVEAHLEGGQVAALGSLVEGHLEAGKVAATGALLDAHDEGGRVASFGSMVEAHNEGGRVAAQGVLVEGQPAPLGFVAGLGLVVEALCTFCFEGVVTTYGVVVEGYERDVFRVREINTKVADLFDRIRNEEERVRDLFDAGDVPDNETRGFVAALTGFREEIRECRRDLDRRDVLDALVYFDGADAIRLWKWERQLRSALVTVDRQLRIAQEVARELLDNRPGRTYVTRAGDTLQAIAVRFFSDPEEWRRISEANPGLTVGELEPGTILNIPEGD